MSHRRIATVVAVLCAAGSIAGPAGASASRHKARYPNEPLAVGTGGAVASMDVGASRVGSMCFDAVATRSTQPSPRRVRSV